MHSQSAMRDLEAAFVDRYGTRPTVGARAPGRVDLMGSHTDYNLGLVMTMAIDRDTVVLAAPAGGAVVEVASANLLEAVTFPVPSAAQRGGEQLTGWGRYVQAVALAVADEGLSVPPCRLLVHTNVPIGGGLSSSAALECAVLQAFLALTSEELSPVDRARLCQRAENRYVGVPCGILDQFSSIMAVEGSVVVLDCRDLSHRAVAVPDGVSFVVCDTNAPRSLDASEYGTRRTQCETGVRLLAAHLPHIRSLRDVGSADYEHLESALPDAVGKRCRFILEENARVTALADAFGAGDLSAIGRLFGGSFAGARDLYEITVPAMEAMIAAMEGSPGCIGARQAGAGFGGCMVAAVEADEVDGFAAAVPAAYEATTGITPDVYPVRPAAGASVIR